MRKITAALSAIVMGVALFLMSVLPAEALANKWCNSRNSYYSYTVVKTDGSFHHVYPGTCYAPRSGDRISMGADSYRVAYNYGRYRECRPGDRRFTPWRGADVIYFKTYRYSECRNTL